MVVSKINKVVKELREAGLRQTVKLRWEAVPDAVPDQPMPPISKKINMIINDILLKLICPQLSLQVIHGVTETLPSSLSYRDCRTAVHTASVGRV